MTKSPHYRTGMLLFLVAVSVPGCETENTARQEEIPLWLKDRIARDEAIIRDDPRSGLDIAAWIRYTYRTRFFYEYHNLLSSAGPSVYDSSGCLINFTQEPYKNYHKEKCCMTYIWKGSYYIGD